MPTIDSGTLELFSSRARRFLAGARRRYLPGDRASLVRKLQAVRRLTSDAVLDFEEIFGGIEYELDGKLFAFGVDFSVSHPYPNQLNDPELTMVPVGLGEGGLVKYYMNDIGELAERPDNEVDVVMKHGSFVDFIEHQAIQAVPRWFGPVFFADLVPALGERLAVILGLRRVEEASDSYEAWWQDDTVSVQQVLFQDNWRSGKTAVHAASLKDLVRAMDRACSVDATTRFKIAAVPSQETRRSKREPWPSADSWAAIRGARQYRYGDKADYIYGVIWVVPERDRISVQQYRFFKGWSNKGDLRGWDSFADAGGVVRDSR